VDVDFISPHDIDIHRLDLNPCQISALAVIFTSVRVNQHQSQRSNFHAIEVFKLHPIFFNHWSLPTIQLSGLNKTLPFSWQYADRFCVHIQHWTSLFHDFVHSLTEGDQFIGHCNHCPSLGQQI